MAFTVTASLSARAVSFQRGSMLAALEQALTLLSSGMEDVRIVDSHGRSHLPADFSRALFKADRTSMPDVRAA